MNMLKEKIQYPEKQKPEDEKYCEKIVGRSIEKVEAEGFEIGSGKTAKVLISDMDEHICMKAISDKKVSPNDVEKEMYFLDKLGAEGFNVPKPVCSVRTNKKDYLFMETIGDGTSIEDIIKDGTGEKMKSLPSGFNFDKFFKELSKEVERMHGKGIYHRDLHAGNIMIDKNGEPVIIDFGDAKEVYFSEDDPYRDISVKAEATIYTKDEDNITSVRSGFGLYLREKGYFENN